MDLDSLVQLFIDHIQINPDSNICIKGNFGTNNDRFLSEIANISYFEDKDTLIIDNYNKKEILKTLKNNNNSHLDYIIVFSEIWDIGEWKNILENHNISGKIITFDNQNNTEIQDTSIFIIPEIRFREYAEVNGMKISMADILQGNTDIDGLQKLAEAYLKHGSFIQNIADNSNIIEDFYKKCTIISEELFEKEKDEFINFIKALALNIGSLHKEDQIAQNLNISRRKVKKYTSLLEKYSIITTLNPFVKNETKELSRHKKVYFSDLSYYFALLGDNYGIGMTKIPMIENFVFLELSEKTKESHNLYFWKKKSGTGISFVLEDKKTNSLTPIDIEFSHSLNPSSTMKSFYEVYENSIQYGMLLTENNIQNTKFRDKNLIIIPYFTI